MDIRFDDKGKFFTDIISKEAVPVIIRTLSERIQGKFHIRPGERIKDALNQAEIFFAVTDATVFDLSGNILYQTGFLAINREHIVWLLPEEELRKNNPESDGAA